MDPLFLDMFGRVLDDALPAEVTRAIGDGAPFDESWAAVAASGFLDALLPEAAGGAGLGMPFGLFFRLGEQAAALPVAETMVARALLHAGGVAAPDGPVALADLTNGRFLPYGAVARHLLVDTGGVLQLLPMAAVDARRVAGAGSTAAQLVGPGGAPVAELARPVDGLLPVVAVLYAAQMAGAVQRVLEMTVAYAGTRRQFGKPIGRQQAVQQNLAVMAEEAMLAAIAAQVGCAGDSLRIGREAAAVAKTVAGRAAGRVAALAHAVFGAIGISAEHALQLYTRRLRQWAFAAGGAGYWSGVLGADRLAQGAGLLSVDYVRRVAGGPAA